jgi:sugar/nucleoside kinase (ribokinase family)
MISPRELDCLVAGDANIDLLLDGVFAPQHGAEKLAHTMSCALGGSSAITAYILARLGLRTGFAALLGDDVFGHYIQAELARAGLDLTALRMDRKEKTGITVWHSEGQSRGAVTYAGAIAKLKPAQISASLHRARHLHMGAYFLLASLHSGAEALFRKARRAGLTTSLDCNYDPAEKWDSEILSVLPHTDIFFPNEAEALRITRTKSVEKAALRLSEEVRIVAIKRGESGVLLRANGCTWSVPARPARVVDTTGAGDSFNAGFLAKFLSGADVQECAEAGVAAAAKTVAVMGGIAAFERPAKR